MMKKWFDIPMYLERLIIFLYLIVILVFYILFCHVFENTYYSKYYDGGEPITLWEWTTQPFAYKK